MISGVWGPGPRSGQGHSAALDRQGGRRSRAGASLTRPQHRVPQIGFPYPCSAENICTAMVK